VAGADPDDVARPMGTGVRGFGGLALLTVGTFLAGCGTSRPTARCAIVAPPPPVGAATPTPLVPPQLTRAGADVMTQPIPMTTSPLNPVQCTAPPVDPNNFHSTQSPIDDFTALWFGTGPSDSQMQRVCPAFPSKLVEQPPSIGVRPCGEAACPNRQLSYDQGNVHVHFLFYEDPSSRPSPSSCYYRLYGMSFAWEGKGPQ
jgi:hypothetical protein